MGYSVSLATASIDIATSAIDMEVLHVICNWYHKLCVNTHYHSWMLKHSTGHMKSEIVGHHILGGKRHLENTGVVPSGY